MKRSLQNKTVIITGASSGVGEAIARQAAQAGAYVILLARTEARLAEIAASIREQGFIEPLYYMLDVSDPLQIEQVFNDIHKKIDVIDVLVNNAGFGIFERFEDANLDDVKQMFDVNVFGLIACTQMVLPTMKNQGSGHIINIASQAGKLATPKSSAYAATKHAVLGLTNSLRMETVHSGINVTAVNPGPIKTNFFTTADESGNYVKNVEKYMLTADEVAAKIIEVMRRPRRELNLPWWMNAGSIIYQLMPRFVERVAGKAFHKK